MDIVKPSIFYGVMRLRFNNDAKEYDFGNLT